LPAQRRSRIRQLWPPVCAWQRCQPLDNRHDVSLCYADAAARRREMKIKFLAAFLVASALSLGLMANASSSKDAAKDSAAPVSAQQSALNESMHVEGEK